MNLAPLSQRREILFYLSVLALIVFGTVYVYDHFFTQLRCECTFLVQKNTFRGEKFFSCSNIDQTILQTDGITDEASSEVPGWRIFRPARPDRPGTIRMKVFKDRNTAFFFPRVSNRDSSVVLAEPTDNIVREWIVVRGKKGEWTPISRRYVVDLTCIGQSSATANGPVEIDIILSGPWAQLWYRDGAILF